VDLPRRPLSHQPITGPAERYRATAGGDQHHHLHREYDRRHHTIWILTTPGADAIKTVRFAGLRGAAIHLTHTSSATG
jgi:hypothetical protein